MGVITNCEKGVWIFDTKALRHEVSQSDKLRVFTKDVQRTMKSRLNKFLFLSILLFTFLTFCRFGLLTKDSIPCKFQIAIRNSLQNKMCRLSNVKPAGDFTKKDFQRVVNASDFYFGKQMYARQSFIDSFVQGGCNFKKSYLTAVNVNPDTSNGGVMLTLHFKFKK